MSLKEAEALRQDLVKFYQSIDGLKEKEVNDSQVKEVNRKIEKLARILVTTNYSRKGKFRHDPALNVPALPDIAPAATLQKVEKGSHQYNVLQTHLTRGQNRLVWALRQARELVSAR